MQDLQKVIKGSLFIIAALEQFDDDSHEHVVLGKQVAESVLIGTLNKYRDNHGEAALAEFLDSIPEVQFQSSDSVEGGSAPVLGT